jgi:hypothetical protein
MKNSKNLASLALFSPALAAQVQVWRHGGKILIFG